MLHYVVFCLVKFKEDLLCQATGQLQPSRSTFLQS